MDMFASRKEEADKICKYFCVDVHFHPLCNAPEDIREKCQMHSTEEGMMGYELDVTKLEKFILHRCDKLKHLCDTTGHLPAGIAFKYREQMDTDKFAAITYNPADNKLRVHTKVGRNATCPCGSGKKYKKCCGK